MIPKETADFGHIERRDIENALADMLASDQFASSTQLSAFLSFIVTKKLDGQQEDIKAYTIAVDALGKDEGFDPQENAMVRVAAGRLRQVMALYNAGADAAQQPVRIELEPGSYVPKFSVNDKKETDQQLTGDLSEPASAEPALPVPEIPPVGNGNEGSMRDQATTSPFLPKWMRLGLLGIGVVVLANLALAIYTLMRPSPQAVTTKPLQLEQPAPSDIGMRPRIKAFLELPDEPYPEWFKVGELGDSLGVILARFDDYQFLGAERVKKFKNDMLDESVDYSLVLTAYRRQDNVRFFAKLTNIKSKAVIWSTVRVFDRPDTPAGRNVPNIIGRAYAPVASPYGVLYANISNSPNQRSELDCVIKGYRYFYTKTSQEHAAARDCAEKIVERGTRLPSIYAMLTFLYLDEFRENRNPRERNPLAAASRTAKQAVALGPQSARAHQALFASHKVQGHRKMAKAAAEKALILNPYDIDIIGDYAAWLISIGDVKTGQDYLTRLEGMLDARPAWLDFYRFLGAELLREFETANDISRMMDIKRAPLLAVAVAIGAHSRGDSEDTKRALAELVRAEPGFLTDPLQQFIKRGFDQKVAQHLVDKLKNAGLKNAAGL